MLKYYCVDIPVHGYVSADILADSEEEAITKGKELLEHMDLDEEKTPVHGYDVMFSLHHTKDKKITAEDFGEEDEF